jgi:hypothetical protein
MSAVLKLERLRRYVAQEMRMGQSRVRFVAQAHKYLKDKVSFNRALARELVQKKLIRFIPKKVRPYKIIYGLARAGENLVVKKTNSLSLQRYKFLLILF